MIVRIRERISLLKNRIKVYIKQLTPEKLIKDFTPPIMVGLVNLLRNPTLSHSTGYYFGVYSSFKDCWEQNRELLSKSGSFNNPAYGQWSLQQTKDFLAKSLWELPDNQNLIKFLSCVSLELGRKGSLRIFDLGGGVGYHYIRCQAYLKNPQIDYTVFDMPEVVSRGKIFRKTEGIHFIDSMPPPEETKFDMILLSSVLHYIDDWQKLLKGLTAGYKPDIVFLSRLPAGDIPDFVTMQTIPQASFPAHCFNYTKLKEFCSSLNYTIEDAWDEGESFDLYDKGRRYIIPRYKGMILRRIE